MADRARIIELAQERLSPKSIAAKLGLHVNTVYYALRVARQNGVDIPHFSAGKPAVEADIVPPATRQVAVPMRLFSLLEQRAEQKGVTTTEAAQHLLETALLQGVQR